MTVLCDWLIP